MDIGKFVMSQHAIQRALDMGIDGDAIRNCLLRPEDVRPQYSYQGRDCYDWGVITCVVDRPSNTVVTVLWRTPELWEQDISKAGEYAGRKLRR